METAHEDGNDEDEDDGADDEKRGDVSMETINGSTLERRSHVFR